jgi:hypothetical protein
MKQHITIEQMNELSMKHRKKLHDWCIVKKWYKLPHKKYWVKYTVPLLTVGQMIEFLNTTHTVHMQQWMDEFKDWRVGLDWSSAEHFYYIVEKPELVDALWEAVKEILND